MEALVWVIVKCNSLILVEKYRLFEQGKILFSSFSNLHKSDQNRGEIEQLIEICYLKLIIRTEFEIFKLNF